MKKIKYLLGALIICVGLMYAVPAQAATKAQQDKVKDIMLEMLYTADFTEHNIYQYKLSYAELQTLIDELKSDEGKMIMAAYDSNMYFGATFNRNIINTIYIVNGSADVLDVYERLCKNVETIRSGIDPGMTDMDKVLYLHDALVNLVSYQFTDYSRYGISGALGDGKAVCAGYTKALNFLLDLEGIEAYYAYSDEINHAWSFVKIDGEWYHVDATHDDTRSSISGQPSHHYFVRNDAEFTSNVTFDHKEIGVLNFPDSDAAVSDSTLYTDWFVHGITGNMFYDAGYWYYIDFASWNVKKAKIDGSGMQNVYDISDYREVILEGVDNGILTLNADGKTLIIDPSKVEADKDDSSQEKESISDIDFTLFRNWRSGDYHYQNGAYIFDQTRICLADYVSASPETQYDISISNTDYHVLIRELDENFKFIKSHNLSDQSSLTTNASTRYLAVSIYSPSLYSLTYAKYKTLFADGFVAKVTDTSTETDSSPVETPLPEVEVDTDSLPENNTTFIPDNGSDLLDYLDFTDFSNWQSGIYHYTTGKYQRNIYRLCLNDVMPYAASSFATTISDSSFRILVRELDSDKVFLRSVTLADGDEYEPGADAEYLAVGIYRTYGENTLSYDLYKTMFQNGFVASLTPVSSANDIVTNTLPSITTNTQSPVTGTDIEDCDMTDFTNWKSGCYDWNTGAYMVYTERICLTEYKTFSSNKYRAQISVANVTYNLSIRELNANKKLIRSVFLSNGATYVPSSDARYLAVTLYKADYDWGASYNKYESLFSQGFSAQLLPLD